MKIIVICNLRFRSNFPEHDGLRISDLVKEPPHCFQSNFGPSTYACLANFYFANYFLYSVQHFFRISDIITLMILVALMRVKVDETCHHQNIKIHNFRRQKSHSSQPCLMSLLMPSLQQSSFVPSIMLKTLVTLAWSAVSMMALSRPVCNGELAVLCERPHDGGVAVRLPHHVDVAPRAELQKIHNFLALC